MYRTFPGRFFQLLQFRGAGVVEGSWVVSLLIGVELQRAAATLKVSPGSDQRQRADPAE
jgi:hypothetical protein